LAHAKRKLKTGPPKRIRQPADSKESTEKERTRVNQKANGGTSTP